MSQPDNLQRESARLTQRQGQLEQQQSETTRTVDAIQRDANTMTGAVDRRIEGTSTGGSSRG